ncbi:MAG: Gfo/Idh/MocA family protein [Planctomycetaceae bacterium]
MARALPVGLVGCGNWGRHILRDLVALGCRVTVVARSEASRARAREGGAAAVVATAEELPPLAGAVVATPTSTHAAVIEGLLPLGIPIFVEKPMAHDAARARALAERGAGRLFVMDKWRYHPGVALLASLARTGELGEPFALRTARLQWGNPHADVDCIWTLAPHDLAICLEVLGCLPEPRAAFAQTSGGATVGLLGVLGSSPTVLLELSARSHRHRREIRLHCSGGTAVLDDAYAGHVEIRTGSPDGGQAPIERRALSQAMPLFLELEAFVRHLDGGPPPRSSADEGAAIVETISALRRLAGLAAS